MKNYDVAIIGAGPAGLFAAHYILEHSECATILLIDKGKAAQERKCYGNCCVCTDKERCNVLCGVGGGGLFSDGKLVLDLHSGGKLDTISNLSEKKRDELKNIIVETLRKHDGKSEQSPDITIDEQQRWQSLCKKEGLEIKHYNVLHMGTENLHHITTRFANTICKSPRVFLKLNCEIEQVNTGLNGESILDSNSGESFSASNVIFAVGKTGSGWLKALFAENGIELKKESTYLGIRLETSHEAIKELFEYSFDPKIWAHYGSRKVKTHCFCRHGDIVCTNYMGFPIVGGHTRFTVKNQVVFEQQSSKGNFNILVSTEKDSQDICEVLKQFSLVNSNGVVVQKLSDFLHPERCQTKDDIPTKVRSKTGNIRGILDSFDAAGTHISDFVLRLSKIVPGILSEDSLVYAPALEWFMDSVKVDSNMETSNTGWFAVGDGAGLSQGIVHSAATSLIAAEEICKRIQK
ncbi:MAG: hypothetical protein IJE29_06140 [Firmicutes bacterium]|nr:hypothetical protein [Bacillota bacterium]MBQ3199433.1 hypothetical protein [Bacillota bacterium]